MHIVDPGKTAQTASIFATYPVQSFPRVYITATGPPHVRMLFLQADFITFANAWYSEFVGTALLCAFVMAVTDKSK
jgi:glycerol uptake facilitator-like aquaporin